MMIFCVFLFKQKSAYVMVISDLSSDVCSSDLDVARDLDGSQVDLLSVKVTGDILTVAMRCSSPERYNRESIRVAQVSVIDDATSQRIGVLKDNEGNAMVSNLVRSSSPETDNMMVDCTSKPGVMWAKFPAPPATSATVSINLPGVAPFDGIPVQR